jgi:MraZ protein
MTQFLGTHIGKVDRKGRISVPAPFRGVLESAGSEEQVARDKAVEKGISAAALQEG